MIAAHAQAFALSVLPRHKKRNPPEQSGCVLSDILIGSTSHNHDGVFHSIVKTPFYFYKLFIRRKRGVNAA